MGNIHLVTGYAGQEHVTAADMGAFNASVFGGGQYVTGNGNQLAASVVTNNQIRVLDGDIIMQGRHIRLNPGTYVDLTIENGAQGMLRNDLIVARYTKNSTTGVEDCNLVVIKGTPATSSPADPAYTAGDIIGDGDILNDMPLYRVPLNGLNVGTLVRLFDVKASTPSFVETTMLAASWTGKTYSFEGVYPSARYNIRIEVAPSATVDQFEAFGAAMICGSANSNVATALGDVPAVNIPIIVKVVVK